MVLSEKGECGVVKILPAGIIREAVEHEERLFDEVETIRECSYLGDKASAGGGCEAAVTD